MKEEEFTSSFAWATLVMQNELYVCGALVLGQSLRNNHSRASMICMVTDDVTRECQQALEDVWDFVVVVPKIVAAKPVQQRTQTRFGHMYRPWLQNCLTKFNILQMVHLQKICFLDSDMLCLSNPDDLFECRTPAGVCDSLRFTIDAQDLWHGRHLPEAEVRNALNGHHYGIAGTSSLLHRCNVQHHISASLQPCFYYHFKIIQICCLVFRSGSHTLQSQNSSRTSLLHPYFSLPFKTKVSDVLKGLNTFFIETFCYIFFSKFRSQPIF